jgi:hypothetical protein
MNENNAEIVSFVPTMNKRRKERIDAIVQELNRRNFKSLDETNKEDIEKVTAIVQDMNPDATARKCVEYSRVAIRVWKNAKN